MLLLMKADNKVSIIINVHNGQGFIENSLCSALNQSYKNLEIIIWDNASTDKTGNIVKRFTDKKIKYYYSNLFEKLYVTRNRAVEMSTGEFITFLDVDDELTSDSIKNRINLLDSTKREICISNLYISKNFGKKKSYYNKINKPKLDFYNLLNKYNICFLSVMFRKKIFNKFKFDHNYNILGDFDLILRLSKEYEIEYSKTYSGTYNVHATNYTNTNFVTHIKEIRKWFIKNSFTLLKNKKKLKAPIIKKYIVLHQTQKVINLNLINTLNYFIFKKKNFLYLKILKNFLAFKLLKND
jgi:glycosyltransferase involved in cell wall biosynthesis